MSLLGYEFSLLSIHWAVKSMPPHEGKTSLVQAARTTLRAALHYSEVDDEQYPPWAPVLALRKLVCDVNNTRFAS